MAGEQQAGFEVQPRGCGAPLSSHSLSPPREWGTPDGGQLAYSGVLRKNRGSVFQ